MVKTRRVAVTAVVIVAGGLIAGGYWFCDRWLPRTVGNVITERFGDNIRVGAVRYVFPLSVEARDVVFVRRPGVFLSGEAARTRVKISPKAVATFRWDARLLKEVSIDGFTLYVYPPRLAPERPPAKTAGTERRAKGNTAPRFSAKRRETGWPAPAAAVTDVSTPSAPVKSVPPAPAAKKMPRCDFTVRTTGGRAVLRREREDNIILTNVGLQGRVTQDKINGTLTGVTARRGAFWASFAHDFTTDAGWMEYKLEAVEAVHLLALGGKPQYLLEAGGVVTLTGGVKWRQGKFDHRATGRLSGGRLKLAPGRIQFILEDVTVRFRLHNAILTIDEGSCRAAEVRWRFRGTAARAFLDFTFRSESMTLQKLADLFVTGVEISYAGVGTAEFRVAGTPREPEFSLRVERTDSR